MPIPETITAIDCVATCDTLTELDDAQFYALLIDRLLTASGIDIADITAEDLTTAVDTARCDLQDRSVFSTASPQTQKAIVLHLLSLL